MKLEITRHIDLQSPDKIKRRQAWRLAGQLVCLQLMLVMAVVGLLRVSDVRLQRREAEEADLAARVRDERFAVSEYVAEALGAALALVSERDRLLALLEIPDFDPARLARLADTAPPGVRKIHIAMDESGAQITALAEDLRRADDHLAAWLASGLVEEGHLVSAVRLPDGTTRYTLALVWPHD